MARSKGRPGESKETRKARLEAPEYQRLRRHLERSITKAGASKRSLSLSLTGGRDPAYLHHILTGLRTVEITEFIELARAVGTNPLELLALVLMPDVEDP